MGNALMRRSGSGVGGAIPAVASALLPGLGQLINREGSKAVGLAAVWAVCGLGVVGALPLIGTVAGLVGGGTWVYAVVDGYVTGRHNKRN